MANETTTTKGLFPPVLVEEIRSSVKGHSSLAKLSKQDPLPFSGSDYITFSMDGECAIVGEGEAKPAGDAKFAPVQMKPIKIVYQHRVTDEFMKMSNEKRLPYLKKFKEGFAKKAARALDIAGITGLNPATKLEAASVGTNCFAKAVTNKVTYDALKVDDNIDDAATLITDADKEVNGLVLAPEAGSAIGKMKNNAKVNLYPEFRFGANPGNFGGLAADVNSTCSYNKPTNKIKAIAGDFQNCFAYGVAQDMTFEVIEYGDPDNTGKDLKAYNQVCLRGESYIGWAIFDKDSFALIEAGA